MPYYGSGFDNRPPLPPRPQPSPSPVLGQTYASKYGNPQSRPQAQGGDDVPPPIPQRPASYNVRPSPSPSPAPVSPMTPPPAFASMFQASGQGSANYPPPPSSPNRFDRMATPPLPPRPVSAQSHLQPGAYAGSGTGFGHSSRPQSSQGNQDPQNPYGWTKFPPPPPGPPPRPSGSPGSTPHSPPATTSPASTYPAATVTVSDSQPAGPSKASMFPMKDPEIPDVPAPAYNQPQASLAPGPSLPGSGYVVSPLPTSYTPTFHPSPLSTYAAPTQNTSSYFPQSPPLPQVPPKPSPGTEEQIDHLLNELQLGHKNPGSASTATAPASSSVQTPPNAQDATPPSSYGVAFISELEDTTSPPPRPPKTLVTPPPPQQYSKPAEGHHGNVPSQTFTAELPGDLPQASTTTPPPPVAASRPAASTSVAPICIDMAVTFEATWYTHPTAPDFPICSYCYTQHISPSPFRETFRGAVVSDGKPRLCRFSKPRVKDHLFKTAVATGHIQPVLNWMRLRSSILDCRGVTPLKGDAGHKWFRPREGDDIPGFVVCQACYEDHVLTNSLSAFFEPTQLQGANEWWACDMAVPYILSVYNDKGKSKTIDAWKSFATETKGRMAMAPCPGRKFSKSHGKRWFVPNDGVGPRDLVVCHACYCDHVAIHPNFAPSWHEDTDLARRFTNEVRCSIGSKFNVKMSLSACEETKDFGPFWQAMKLIGDGAEKVCDEKGIVGGTWYTLPSNPPEFGICRACFVTIGPALAITQFFVPKHHHEEQEQGGKPLLCCLNLAHPRLKSFIPKLMEMYFTRSRAGFEAYVTTYASVPPCPRENETSGRKWFGWRDCTICPECYHDFAGKAETMVARMELRDGGVLLPEANMCEMYSSRMRNLYTSCASSGDTGPLRAFAARRRLVYLETVPRMRQMVQEQRLRAQHQGMMNTMSTFHTNAGQLQQINFGTGPYTYSAPGVGSGFANVDALQGAMYGRSAMGDLSDATAAVGIVRELERRWREVE